MPVVGLLALFDFVLVSAVAFERASISMCLFLAVCVCDGVSFNLSSLSSVGMIFVQMEFHGMTEHDRS